MKLQLSNRGARLSRIICIVALNVFTVSSLQAQTQITTDHFYAGATGTTSSDQLIWGNASVFSAGANYFNLSYSTGGTYSGFYNAAFTMTGPGGGPIYSSPSTPFSVDFRAADVPEPSITALLGLEPCGLAARKVRGRFAQNKKP